MERTELVSPLSAMKGLASFWTPVYRQNQRMIGAWQRVADCQMALTATTGTYLTARLEAYNKAESVNDLIEELSVLTGCYLEDATSQLRQIGRLYVAMQEAPVSLQAVESDDELQSDVKAETKRRRKKAA
jgi:hypothetical protein